MAVKKYTQFGRYIEVKVKNYNTKKETTIPNDFKIVFQFYKTIDEVNEASVGEIKIYGLTQETFEEINDVNNEVMLNCGYGYSYITTLFIANVVEVNRTYEDGTIVTTLKVSANYAEYSFNNISIQNPQQPTTAYMFSIAKEMDMLAALYLENIPQQHRTQVKEYLDTKLINFSAAGSSKQVLNAFCNTLRLSQFIGDRAAGKQQSKKVVTFNIQDSAVDWYIKQSYKPYSKDTRHVGKLANLYVHDTDSDSDNAAILLNADTGMLGYPQVETKIDKVPSNWKVQGNEEITLKGQQTILDNQQKAREAAEKRRKREEKAKEKGKTLKPQKPTTPSTIQISRKFVRLKALLNPLVKPQSHVIVESTLFDYNGIYRVRNVKFVGSNFDGEFTMDLYLEDSTNRKATVATADEIKRFGEGQTGDVVNGDISDVSEVGSEGGSEGSIDTGGGE